jgi:hypothetical protein
MLAAVFLCDSRELQGGWARYLGRKLLRIDERQAKALLSLPRFFRLIPYTFLIRALFPRSETMQNLCQRK